MRLPKLLQTSAVAYHWSFARNRVIRIYVRPYVTEDIPAVGGVIKTNAEDFIVDEIPAYEPSGEGEHLFIQVTKTATTTPGCAKAIADALGIKTRDMGWAGMKDKHAVTTQWMSLPPPVQSSDVSALDLPDIQIKKIVPHNHKLKTGHLRGNRFKLTIRDLNCPGDEAKQRAEAVLKRLSQHPGMPAWYGSQRFGRDNDNDEQARQLLDSPAKARGKKSRFLISSLQSRLFNTYLEARLAQGLLGKVIAGDVLSRPGSARTFHAHPALDSETERYLANEIVPTGPIFGNKQPWPQEQTDAWQLEVQILEDAGLSAQSFSGLGKLARGARRALVYRLEGTVACRFQDDALTLEFELPKGNYATEVLREVMKSDQM